MRNLLLALFLATLACAADSRPRIRAVTAFIEVDRNNYAARIEDAQKFLASAKDALNKAGFEGGGARITTQPFLVYTKGMKHEDALTLIRKMREIATKGRSTLCIGPAMVHDADDTAPAALLADVLSEGSVNGNLIIADEQGIHWRAIREAAKVVKAVSMKSSHGNANSAFGAMAMMQPYGPYYPSSYHLGKGHAFSIAMEGANVVADVFARTHDPREAEKQLGAAFTQYTREAEAVATQLATSSGWIYEGIDATPAPQRDRSIGAATESFSGGSFGAVGSLTAMGIITRAVRSTPTKHAGTSGPMLPVMEDAVLARRWAEGTFNIESLLAYSAVGANGLETVPLPGDVTEEQIAQILGDIATVAYRVNSPLGVRLIPSPGRKAGEKTDFTESFLINTTLQPLPGTSH
jgi:uncharacterized protein (UPF0210 family)